MNHDTLLHDPMLIAARQASEAFALISIKEAAKLLGKSVRPLRRWEAAGQMPPHEARSPRDTIETTSRG